MAGQRQFLDKEAVFIIIHLIFKDGLYGFVVIYSIVKCPAVSSNEAFITSFTGKAKYAHSGFISLLGMLLSLKYIKNIQPDIFVDRGGPSQKFIRCLV